MDTKLKYPEWQRPLQDFMVFRNKRKLLESETAIGERLHGQRVSFDEREALIDALSVIQILKQGR
jgi:hypothetical protein